MRRLRILLMALALFCAPIPVAAFDTVHPECTRRGAAKRRLRRPFRLIRPVRRRLAAPAGRDRRAVPAGLGARCAGRLRHRQRSMTNSPHGLADTIPATELAGIADFLASDFGFRIAALEHATQTVPPDQQLAVLAKGQTLYWSISETRRGQFEELMELSGAEVSFALLSRDPARGRREPSHVAGQRRPRGAVGGDRRRRHRAAHRACRTG